MPIRLAMSADLPALHALIERAYRGDSSRAGWTHEADYLSAPRTSLSEVAAILADPAQTMLVLEEGGALVACVALTDRGDGTVYLGFLTVEPIAQAAGTGRTVLAAAENNARVSGARQIEMTVVDRRRELIAWYERRGYARTGETRPFPAALIEAVPLAFVVLTKPL